MFRQPRLHASEPSAWNSRNPASIGLLDGMQDRERSAARRMFTMVDVAAGKTLVQDGSAGLEFFCVVQGEVDVYVHGRFAGTLGPGDFFGELALLPQLTGSHGVRQATVIARTPTRVAVCHRREFNHLMTTCTEAQRRVYEQAKRLSA